MGFTLLAWDENDRLQNVEEVEVAVICGNELMELHRLNRTLDAITWYRLR